MGRPGALPSGRPWNANVGPGASFCLCWLLDDGWLTVGHYVNVAVRAGDRLNLIVSSRRSLTRYTQCQGQPLTPSGALRTLSLMNNALDCVRRFRARR